jgi:serine/threonine protein kinase
MSSPLVFCLELFDWSLTHLMQILCRKEISYFKMSAKEKEQLQAELSILKELRHPHIVQYYEREHLKATQDLHMYMEYCGNGDLGQVIKDYKRRGEQAPEAFVWSIFAQIATALYRCHNGTDAPEVGDNWFGLSKKKVVPVKGQKYVIIHRDLKPENSKLLSCYLVTRGTRALTFVCSFSRF